MAAPQVNYEDERFAKVETDKQAAMNEMSQTYDNMIGQSDKYYQDQIEASKQWGETQGQLQQEQTDFTIEQVEQQKEQAHKDYLKEQSGAYVDWQKQSNQYGSESEKMAAAGLDATGFSESSQVSMYNQYQNRVAVARESYNRAILNYDNAIKEARIQNNAVLAEIAYQTLQTGLELSLQGFQYKNNLLLEQANKKVEMDNMYYQRWQDVLGQINHENQMAEQIRQYNQDYAFQVKQFDESVRQYNKSYDLQLKQFNESVKQFKQEHDLKVKQYNESIRQFNEEIARLKKKDEQEYKLEIQNLELKKKQMEEDKRQYEKTYELELKKFEETKRQFDVKNTPVTYSGGGGGSGGSGGGSDKLKQDEPKPSTDSGTTKINYQSLNDAGYSQTISEAKMASLVAQGKLDYKVDNNTIYFYAPENKNLAAGQAALDKYTIKKYTR